MSRLICKLLKVTLIYAYTPSRQRASKQRRIDVDAISSKLIYRGSYMSAHVLLNLLNELVKRDKMRGLPFFATSLINSIIQEHEC